ncbi:MAG: thioredoxin domain-containing protein [Gemmatimonadota bacterium]
MALQSRRAAGRAPFVFLALLASVACGSGEAAPGTALTTAQAGVPAPVLDQPLAQPEPERIDISDLGHVRGNPEAPIQVVEFTDFGCGYCKQFHDNTWGTLERNYVDTGKVFWRTVHFNVGMFKNAQDAAVAGECAFAQGGQQRWDEMRVGLFAAQREWKGTDDAGPIFERVAREAGLDASAFQACMGNRDVEEPVRFANDVARRAGVRGTPTFYVNGYPVQGALPLEAFSEFFDRLLEAEAEGAAG